MGLVFPCGRLNCGGDCESATGMVVWNRLRPKLGDGAALPLITSGWY